MEELKLYNSQKKTGVNLCDLELGNGFLEMIPTVSNQIRNR